MRRFASLLFVLPVVACGQPTQSNSTAANDTAAAGATATVPSVASTEPPTAKALGLQPGKWETTVEFLDFEVTGVPAQAKPALPPTRTFTGCIAPDQQMNKLGDMLRNANVDCTTTRSSYAAGRIDVAMTCNLPAGAMSATMTGTYAPTLMTSDSRITVDGGQRKMRQTVRSTARRIGDCD